MNHTSATPRPRRTPVFKSRASELRSLTHSLAADLGLCDAARRNILMSLTGSRYARELSETELEAVVEFFRSQLEAKTVKRVYKLEAVSDNVAGDVLSGVSY